MICSKIFKSVYIKLIYIDIYTPENEQLGKCSFQKCSHLLNHLDL